MLMMKPPIEFLVDTFEYKEKVGENDWGEPIYGDPQLIEFCRIDREAQYTQTTSGKQLLYNAVIFCYKDLTDPILEFTTEGLINFDGVGHVITKVIPIKEPFKDEIYSYEIEVV